MSDQRPERRRFQFGLRKLLLWTAVVAFFLGILTTAGLGPVASISVLCWAVFVRSLRAAFAFTPVAFVAAFSAAALTTRCFWPPSVMMLFAGARGGVYGFAVFVLSEDVSRAIDSRVELPPQRHAFHIPLKRVFLLPFIYALILWWCWGLETEGMVLALACGTTASGTVLLLRWRDFPTVLSVAIFTLLGATVGATCFLPSPFPSLDDCSDLFVSMAMFGITGGFVGSLIVKGKPTGQPHSMLA